MTAILATDPLSLPLDPAPIRSDWILEGAPQARAREIARSADGTAVTVVWSSTPGRFRWFFGVDETVTILEGEVFVADAPGAPEMRLGAGDAAFFPAGSWSCWRVTQTLRKVAVCRHAMPRPLGFALRAWNRLTALALGRPVNALASSPATDGAAIDPQAIVPHKQA